MNSRDEVQRLLAAAGAPPPVNVPELERAVWSRLDTPSVVSAAPAWWRGWSMAGLVAAALALGLVSAAWRLDRLGATDSPDAHARYLRMIDPLVRSNAAGLES